MGRKTQNIKVIVHGLEDYAVRENVQQAVDAQYMKIIVDRLSASGLTYDEQKAALKKLLVRVYHLFLLTRDVIIHLFCLHIITI